MEKKQLYVKAIFSGEKVSFNNLGILLEENEKIAVPGLGLIGGKELLIKCIEFKNFPERHLYRMLASNIEENEKVDIPGFGLVGKQKLFEMSENNRSDFSDLTNQSTFEINEINETAGNFTFI